MRNLHKRLLPACIAAVDARSFTTFGIHLAFTSAIVSVKALVFLDLRVGSFSSPRRRAVGRGAANRTTRCARECLGLILSIGIDRVLGAVVGHCCFGNSHSPDFPRRRLFRPIRTNGRSAPGAPAAWPDVTGGASEVLPDDTIEAGRGWFLRVGLPSPHPAAVVEIHRPPVPELRGIRSAVPGVGEDVRSFEGGCRDGCVRKSRRCPGRSARGHGAFRRGCGVRSPRVWPRVLEHTLRSRGRRGEGGIGKAAPDFTGPTGDRTCSSKPTAVFCT